MALIPSRFFSQNFFFPLDIYRPDGRTLRRLGRLQNGRNFTDGPMNAVLFYYHMT